MTSLPDTDEWHDFADSELRESIHALSSYCFLKRKGTSTTSFNIHPLVHTWGRKRLEAQREVYIGKLSEVFRIISSALDYKDKKSQEHWDFERRHMSHLASIGSHMAKAAVVIVNMRTVDCIMRLGEILVEHGRYKMATGWYQWVLASREKELGVEHLSTLYTVDRMAWAFSSQHKYDLAIEWYQRALAGLEQQLGADHPATQNTIRNLEDFYQERHMLEKAEELRLRFPTAW